MRLRTGFVKKLLLSGATVFSLVGFASPAVFAMDGGNYGGGYNNDNSYSSSDNGYDNYGSNNYGGDNNCMMRYDNNNDWGNWNNDRDCMSHMHHNNNDNNRCDFQYSKQY